MTWTVEHPRRHRWQTERATVPVNWAHHPLRAAGTGLLIVILAAWAGIVAFVGPQFGFRPTSLTSWQWTTNNWLLHLLPGAVGVVGGLLIVGRAPTPRARGIGWLAVLLVVAAGAWLVIGPYAWPLFKSSDAFNMSVSNNRLFLFQLGANLGPGILLAFFGGMALKPGVGTPALAENTEGIPQHRVTMDPSTSTANRSTDTADATKSDATRSLDGGSGMTPATSTTERATDTGTSEKRTADAGTAETGSTPDPT